MYEHTPQKTIQNYTKLIMTEKKFTKKCGIIVIFFHLSVYEIDEIKNTFYKINPSKNLLLNTRGEKLYKTEIVQVN